VPIWNLYRPLPVGPDLAMEMIATTLAGATD
jgi:hypothetical protein